MSFRIYSPKKKTYALSFAVVFILSILVSLIGMAIVVFSAGIEGTLIVSSEAPEFRDIKERLSNPVEVYVEALDREASFGDNAVSYTLRMSISHSTADKFSWNIKFSFENGTKLTKTFIFRYEINFVEIRFERGRITTFDFPLGSLKQWFRDVVNTSVFTGNQAWPTINVFYTFDIQGGGQPTGLNEGYYAGDLGLLFPEKSTGSLFLYLIDKANYENAESYRVISPLYTTRLQTPEEFFRSAGRIIVETIFIAPELWLNFFLLLGIVPTVLSLFFILIDSRLKLTTKMAHFWLKRSHGILGRFLEYLFITSFSGEWIVEEHLAKTYHFNQVRGQLNNIFKNWQESILIPASITGLILAVVWEPFSHAIFVQQFGIAFSISLFLLWLTPILFLVLFFPSVWLIREGGFKRIIFSERGDVTTISDLGDDLVAGISRFFGIPAFFALANKILPTETFLETQATPTLLATLSETVFGGIVDLNIQLPIRIVVAIATLLFLGGFFLPSSALLVFYLSSTDFVKAIKEIRAKVLSEKLATLGTLSPQLKPGMEEDTAVFSIRE